METAEVCGEKAFSETTQTLLKRYRQSSQTLLQTRGNLCFFCAMGSERSGLMVFLCCSRLPSSMAQNLSVPLAFVALLHLANEKVSPSVTASLGFYRFGGARVRMCSVTNRTWSWGRWTTCRTSSSDKATEEKPGVSFHLPDACVRLISVFLLCFSSIFYIL